MRNEDPDAEPRGPIEAAMTAFRTTASCSDRDALTIFLETHAATAEELDALLTALQLYRPAVYAVLDRHARCSVPVPEQYRLLLPRSQLHAVANGYDLTNGG